ncbi:MAG TPA: hypothetical protein VLQ91_09460, partial [Draconibacterium sp.]|nr:hypothetical protein [Draconibacterium sp.]
NVNRKGFWEKGNSILLRDSSDEEFAKNQGLTIEQLQTKVSNWKNILLEERTNRVRPGLDDKTLISWNALVIQGLVDAAVAFKEKRFLNIALESAIFLEGNIIQSDGKLFHSWKQGNTSIDGFLEDYALTVQAFISLFEVTGNEHWLHLSEKLTDYCFAHFYDEESGLFYFAEKNINSIVTNHFQNEDNVIPAANSVMANTLHKLYLIIGKPEYLNIAKRMLNPVISQFSGYPMAFANWGTFMLKITQPYYEIAITGAKAEDFTSELQSVFHPNILFTFSKSESNIPILKDRTVNGKTLIYVCREGVCLLPVESTRQAMEIMN